MKSNTKSTHVGQGVYLQTQKKDLHSNKGKKHFTWTVSYGTTQKVFQDVCDILKTFQNLEEHFEALTWRKCQEEFSRNVASYKADREAVPFRSGSSEEHTKWQSKMEEIF